MLKRRSKIKKLNAQKLGNEFIVEYKIYVPRGLVNTSFFNVYEITGETNSYYQVNPKPLAELQVVRNHLAKNRGDSEWEFSFLYNAEENKTWAAHGFLDPEEVVRSYTSKFIDLIQTREAQYKQMLEQRKEAAKLRKALKEERESNLDKAELAGGL